MNIDQANDLRSLIQSLITICLVRLSDAEHQKREWLKPSKTAYACQLDTIEDFFDQFSDIYFKMLKHRDMRPYLGDTNADLLEKFYQVFHAYAWDRSACIPECCLDFGNVEEVLEDPKWHEIQRMAKELYDALNNSQVISH